MNNSLRLVLILLTLSFLAFLFSGYDIYLRLTYLWLTLVISSWIWTRLTLRKVSLERYTTRHRAQVGDNFIEHITLRNLGRAPLLLVEMHDQSDLHTGRVSRVLTMIKGHSGFSFLNRLRLQQRGVFKLGPTRLRTGDPFGFFETEKIFPPQGSLMIYPFMVNINAFPNPAGRLPGGEALQRKASHVTTNASGVRQYHTGDSLNRIHWLSTARHNQLMVREFELDPFPEIIIFLDCLQSAHVQNPETMLSPAGWLPWLESAEVRLPADTLEYAISITASLARYYLRKRRAVGLLCTTAKPQILAPDRGPRHLRHILETLTTINADGDMPIGQSLTAQIRRLTHGSTLVIVTPSRHPSLVVALETSLRLGMNPLLIWLDANTFTHAQEVDTFFYDIRLLGIPTLRVKFDDNLEEVLNRPITKAQPGVIANIRSLG
ncbi:MAG: DUF58 domain-containing protein [Anaerolineales bacterium]|nr:DUF58 domain-containing protein [Anaerolineales bacterium]